MEKMKRVPEKGGALVSTGDLEVSRCLAHQIGMTDLEQVSEALHPMQSAVVPLLGLVGLVVPLLVLELVQKFRAAMQSEAMQEVHQMVSEQE